MYTQLNCFSERWLIRHFYCEGLFTRSVLYRPSTELRGRELFIREEKLSYPKFLTISNRVCVTHMYFIYFFFFFFFSYNIRTTNRHTNLGKWLLNLRNDVNSPLVDVFTGSYHLCTKQCAVNLTRGGAHSTEGKGPFTPVIY